MRHGNSKVGFGHISINANKTTRSAEIPCHFNAALMALVGSTYQLAGQQKPSLCSCTRYPIHTLLDAWSLLTCSLFIPFSAVTMRGGGEYLPAFLLLNCGLPVIQEGQMGQCLLFISDTQRPSSLQESLISWGLTDKTCQQGEPQWTIFLCWKLQQKS